MSKLTLTKPEGPDGQPLSKGRADALLDEFFPQVFKASEFKPQPLNLATFMALEKIGSPLAKFGEVLPVSSLDIARAVLFISLPAQSKDDVQRIRKFADDADLLDEVAWGVAARIPLSELLQLGPNLAQHVQAGMRKPMSPESGGKKE